MKKTLTILLGVMLMMLLTPVAPNKERSRPNPQQPNGRKRTSPLSCRIPLEVQPI